MNEVARTMQGYHAAIEHALREAIARLGEPSQLRSACEYALLTEGKRFRPAIVLMIADALGTSHSVMKAALSTEFFHTASLIADDLPCMDNAAERRGVPTLHKKFDESIALLATYALIAEGYQYIAENIVELKQLQPAASWDDIGVHAFQNATWNTGIRGATGGQFLDLYPPNSSEETLTKLIHMKTTALFEVSFVLGWLFGGGSPTQLHLVKELSRHFGLAFQIADDLGDVEEDARSGLQVNFALMFGAERACAQLEESAGICEELALTLGLRGEAFSGIMTALRQVAACH